MKTKRAWILLSLALTLLLAVSALGLCQPLQAAAAPSEAELLSAVQQAVANTRAAQGEVQLKASEVSELGEHSVTPDIDGLIDQQEIENMFDGLANWSIRYDMQYEEGAGTGQMVKEGAAFTNASGGTAVSQEIANVLSEFFVPAEQNAPLTRLLTDGNEISYAQNVAESIKEDGTRVITFDLRTYDTSAVPFVLLNSGTIAELTPVSSDPSLTVTVAGGRASLRFGLDASQRITTVSASVPLHWKIVSGSASPTDPTAFAITFYYDQTVSMSATLHYGETEPEDPEDPQIVTGMCGPEARYSLNLTTGALEITGAGEVWDNAFSKDKFANALNIQTVTVAEGITRIGSNAFGKCTALREITLPEQLTDIGNSILYGCSNLQKMTVSFPVIINQYDTYYVEYFYPLGYFFGTNSFAGAARAYQRYEYKYSNNNYSYGNSRSYYIPDSLKTVVVKGNRVPGGAFQECRSLEAIELPEWVESIGPEAFASCSSLKSLVLPRDLTSCGEGILRGCGSLETLTTSFYTYTYTSNNYHEEYQYPLGYFFGTRYGSELFYGAKQKYMYSYDKGYSPYSYYNTFYCSIPYSLKTVNIYGGRCPAGALMNCTQLETVNFLEPVEEIGAYAFAYCANLQTITLPSDVTSIGEYAFVKCQALPSIDLPDGLHAIGKNAFYGCGQMTSLSVPGSVEEIGPYAFAQCTSLASLVLNEGIEKINYHAFSGCAALQELSVPSTVYGIGSAAFAYCSSLQRVSITAGTRALGSSIFRGSFKIEEMTAPLIYHPLGYYFGGLAYADTFENVTPTFQGYRQTWYPNTYLIPDSLQTFHVVGNALKTFAFMNCANVKTVTLPDGLRRISGRAFYAASGIESIVIPKSVKVIDAEAFRDCVNLRAVGFAADPAAGVPDAATAGSKLKLIGANAFRNCDALTEMTVPYFVGTIGEQAFYDCDALQKVVFAGRDGGTTAELPRTKLQTIDAAAFGRCELLENVNLPFRVTTIGRKAFVGDLGLTKLTIPRYVKTIGAFAFYNCRSVSEIEYCAKAVSSVEGHYYYHGNKEGVYRYRTNRYHPFYRVGADTDGLTVTFTDTVRKVPDRLFYRNTALKKLVLSAKVTDIGNHTFARCERLSKIVYQTGADETAAQPAQIALSRIGYRAFSDCTALRMLYIPAGLKTMGGYAFSNCTKVGTIYYKAKAMNRGRSCSGVFDAVGNDANGLTVVICNTVRSVPARLLYNNKALQRLSVSQRVRTIGDSAFEGCENLNEVTFAAAVRRTLSDLSFTRLTEIGSRAFARCAALPRIDIPESVATIGNAAFAGCHALKQVHFGTKDTATGTDVSRSRLCEISAGTFRKCRALESIIIPDSVEAIGWNAFEDCTHLKNVYFGSIENTAQTAQLLSIEGFAFHNCKRMNWFKFPQTVSTVGWGAFQNCRSLRKLNLPESVSSVQTAAFEECARLRRITVSNASCVISYDSTTFPEGTTLYAYSNHSSAKAYSILFVRDFKILHSDSHTVRAQDEIPAKCTEEGYTAGIYCEDCEAWIDGHETIPAHGHRYVVASQIPATDTQEAALLFVCAYDHSHLLYEPIGSDHKPGKPVIENEVAATCTTPGSYDSVVYCTDCGQELSRSSVTTAKAPHTPGTVERKNEVPPTCQKDGSVTVITYCSVCGNVMKTEQVVLPKSDHLPGPTVRENVVAATATTAGSYDAVVYCTECGAEISREAKTIAPLAHEHIFTVSQTKPATCTQAGERTLVCSVCGETKTEPLPLAAHTDSDNNGSCDVCGAKMTGGDHCKYCGQIHGGAFGWLTKFFHSILAIFQR